MAGVTPSPTQTTSHVSARARTIPPGLVSVSVTVLLAAAVGLLALVPSLAQAVWEVPRLFLLGLVISYGVFAQRNGGVDKAGGGGGDGDGNATKDGSLAWNARYHPDDALVMVADHNAAPGDDGQERARERPLSLPVRRLKPASQESETGDANDGVSEETDSSASSSGFWGARAAPSPPSVLDVDLGLSPCSQPQSPPFFAHSTTKSRGFSGYHLSVPRDLSEDGEVTDWDEEADGLDEMTTLSSERSFRGDFTACVNDHNDGDRYDDDTSFDEELLKLATKAAPEGEEEVDRKADEFIAKFREQIRLQRV
ncbi:uncharacterized protein LOC133917627 [Phragmites australis]|uniref:uncharacterized protein LOC133917627 n=1 Tax=Phragmites australis TaxID=29695 RepID=UPI002D7708B7|nr:uncharacterized protein LOC133917627 [Phragmites australis]